MNEELLWNYRGVVDRVVDGDTVYLTLDLGFHLSRSGVSYRLLDVDTPEIRGQERPAGLIAKARVEELLPVGTEVLVRTRKSGKYGRYLVTITLPSGEDLGEVLLREGLAERD